jgi:hypothetical protein
MTGKMGWPRGSNTKFHLTPLESIKSLKRPLLEIKEAIAVNNQ